jgi:FkbM family methyltransferase
MPKTEKQLSEHELIEAVRELLAEGEAGAIERERSAFDRISASSREIVLFGAGRLGHHTLSGLRRAGIEPLFFTDNNPQLWNTCIEGVVVLAPAEAVQQYGKSATFVITIWSGHAIDTMAEREQQLNALGCERVVPFTYLFWKFGDVMLPHYALELPHKVHQQCDQVLAACVLWSDPASRYEYLAQLRWRLLGDFAALNPPVTNPTYFPTDLYRLTKCEVFVDCGAYDGDTIRSFLKQSQSAFARIFAFEPDPASFARLEASVSELRHTGPVTLQQAAVGARTGRVSFCASADQSSYVSQGAGNLDVDCVTIDETLKDAQPSYIKMDIEGAELDALTGARRLIERHSPVLAVCSEHAQDHLWRIPLLIRSFNPGYRFFLRPHLSEVWDLVCYAIPNIVPRGGA